MFATLLGIGHGRGTDAAEELQRRLEEKASLVVDSRLVADLGVGRRALYRIIYDMVRRERMFMLSDESGQMLLMSNTEFNRFMFRRAGKEAPETPRSAPAAALAETADSDMYLESEDSDLVLEGRWEIPAAALDSPIAGNLSHAIPEPGIPEPLYMPAERRRSPRKAAASAAAPMEMEDDLDWFRLDIAPAGADGAGAAAELPDHRQTLPERRREPWTILEEAESV